MFLPILAILLILGVTCFLLGWRARNHRIENETERAFEAYQQGILQSAELMKDYEE